MIILNREEIEAHIDLDRAAKLIEEAYRATSLGQINLPPVGHITFPEFGGDCHIKYGHVEGDPVFVIKVATGFPHNDAKRLPNNNGVSLVLSAQTGQVKAVLHDEGHMTDVRTAIGGAIATRALCRADCRHVAIIGTGVQARMQIEAHVRLMTDHRLDFTVWGRSADRAVGIAEGFSDAGVRVRSADDLEQTCAQADIIVTTTGAREPVVRREWVRRGTHITAVGADAPGKQELDTELTAVADRLVADLKSQCIDHGEFAIPAIAGRITDEQVVELGDVLRGSQPGRTNEDEITIADLTGLAAQDIAIARTVLDAVT